MSTPGFRPGSGFLDERPNCRSGRAYLVFGVRQLVQIRTVDDDPLEERLDT